MKLIKRLLITFFLSGQVMAFACRCKQHQLDVNFYNDANLIFIGKVLKAKKGLFFYKMKFEVIQSYKGKKRRIKIKSDYSSCGLRGLHKGDTMVMFGYNVFGINMTDGCMLNGKINDDRKKRDTAFLNKITKLRDSIIKTDDAEGKLKNGLAEGVWTYASKPGANKVTGNYKKGKMHGLWTEYDSHGNIVSQEYYRKNKLKWDKNYHDGKIINECKYALSGLVEKIEKDYYPNGNPSKVFDNILYGFFMSYKEYYPNGKLKEKGRFGPGGNYFGKSKFYNEEGKLVKKERPKGI